MPRKLTTPEFIERAKAIHGDTYDYRCTKYELMRTKVAIICREHGEFLQNPVEHLAGCGCPTCGLQKRAKTRTHSNDDFLQTANIVHGDYYTYPEEYNRFHAKLKIVCPVHGAFYQTPAKHLSGQGCIECGYDKMKKAQRLTAQQFIEKAIEVHSNEYGYELVNYVNTDTPVSIICKAHGVFSQAPDSHLQGKGCPSCVGRKIRESKALTKDECIARFRKTHGDRYGYEKVKYVNAQTPVIIECKKHGDFVQKPYNHINGNGCPACAESGISMQDPGILYYLRVETRTHSLWKIGITNKTVEDRFRGADLKNITTLMTWPYRRSADAYRKEQDTLIAHADWLYQGIEEPLARGGNTELFTRDVLGLDPEYK